ncbi:MAG: hypothetical protein PHS84_05130 [Paludibacter sp.]|jgi:hypothetical protein|nr:hypothetical protein [Paludibacter sp.]
MKKVIMLSLVAIFVSFASVTAQTATTKAPAKAKTACCAGTADKKACTKDAKTCTKKADGKACCKDAAKKATPAKK